MKKPSSFVIYICLSLSACLAAQHFCAAETEKLLAETFGKGAHTASAIITGADRLAFLFYGMFLYGVSAQGDYAVKYFCGFSLASAFLCRMCVFCAGAAAGAVCTVFFLSFFAVVFCHSVSLRQRSAYAAPPVAVMSLFLCILRFL